MVERKRGIGGAISAAVEIVSKHAEKAASERDIKAVEYRARQTAAISELEEEKRRIFRDYGVEDLEENIVFSKRVTQEEDYNFDELTDNTLGEVISFFRVREGISKLELSRNANLGHNTVSRIELGNTNSLKNKTIISIINGFGWDLDDKRALFLLNKAEESRIQPDKRKPGKS